MGSHVKKFKTSLLQITAKSFQTFPAFSCQWSFQNYNWDFEIVSFRFLTFFLGGGSKNVKVTIVQYVETENINYLENQRS